MTKSGVLSAKKDFLVPTKGECFGKLRGEGLFPVKLAKACPEQIEGTALLIGLIDQGGQSSLVEYVGCNSEAYYTDHTADYG